MLLDFGAALEGLPERTITIMASPKFSPPEQYDSNGNIGPWSDLFALGCTMIVGLGARRSDYPSQFRRTLQKATRLEIKERFQSAAQWQAYLRKTPAETRFLSVMLVLILVVISLGAVWIFNGKKQLPASTTPSAEPVAEASSGAAGVTNADTEKEAPSKPKAENATADTAPPKADSDDFIADTGQAAPAPDRDTDRKSEDISPRPSSDQVAHEPTTDSAAPTDDKSLAPDTLVGLRMKQWGSDVLKLQRNFRQLPLFAQFYLLRDYSNLANAWEKARPFHPEGIMAADIIQFKPDGRWNVPKGNSGNYGYIKVSDTQGVLVFETLDDYDENSLFYFYLYFTERGKGVAIAGDGAEYTYGNIEFELSTDNLDLVKRKIPESTDILFPYFKDEALTKAVAPKVMAGRMVQFDASQAEYCPTSPMPKGLKGMEQQEFYKKTLGAALQSRSWRPGGKLPMTEPISFIGMASYAYLSEKGWYMDSKITEKRIGVEINRPDGRVDYFVMEFVKPGEGWAAYYGGGDKAIRNIRVQMALIPQKKLNDIAPDEFFKEVRIKVEKVEAAYKAEEKAHANVSSVGEKAGEVSGKPKAEREQVHLDFGQHPLKRYQFISQDCLKLKVMPSLAGYRLQIMPSMAPVIKKHDFSKDNDFSIVSSLALYQQNTTWDKGVPGEDFLRDTIDFLPGGEWKSLSGKKGKYLYKVWGTTPKVAIVLGGYNGEKEPPVYVLLHFSHYGNIYAVYCNGKDKIVGNAESKLFLHKQDSNYRQNEHSLNLRLSNFNVIKKGNGTQGLANPTVIYELPPEDFFNRLK